MNRHKEFFLWRRDLEAKLTAGSRVAVTANGPVEYAVRGSLTRPSLVFIHGGPGGYDQAFSYLDYLSDESICLVSWSRPGYLRTPLASGKTIPQQADLLAGLLDYLGLERVVLNAFSAGGPVALAFALRHPDRVRGMIMESTVTKAYTPETRIQRLLFHFFLNDPVTWLCNLLAEYAPASIIKSFLDIESDLDAEEVATVLKNVIRDDRKEQVMMGMIKSISPFSLRKTGLENDLEQLAALDDMPVENIQVPVLIFHGDHDAEVRDDHPKTLCRRLGDAELVRVPDGIHELSISSHIEDIRKKKMDFLRSCYPDAGQSTPSAGTGSRPKTLS